MSNIVISEKTKDSLLNFLKKNPSSDLVTTYLFFLEQQFHIQPVILLKEKKIYQNLESAISHLEKLGLLWRETEINIHFQKASVDSETKKIYICPFTGKVFGDNTHQNPQDAIYDWVSNCPENTEFSNGVRSKRFFISEDPAVIKSYITAQKTPVKKTVYSSMLSGKLYNSKNAILDDFNKTQVKPIPLTQVPRQNRFQIEDSFLAFIQENLQEDKLASFTDSLRADPTLEKYAEKWLEEESTFSEES